MGGAGVCRLVLTKRSCKFPGTDPSDPKALTVGDWCDTVSRMTAIGQQKLVGVGWFCIQVSMNGSVLKDYLFVQKGNCVSGWLAVNFIEVWKVLISCKKMPRRSCPLSQIAKISSIYGHHMTGLSVVQLSS